MNDAKLWQTTLSVYLKLYSKGVFRKGSGTYKRMVEIMISHFRNHYMI